MQEFKPLDQQKIDTTTGLKIRYPSGWKISTKRMVELRQFSEFIERSFGQKVHTIFMNESLRNQEKLHSISFMLWRE